MLPLAGMLLQDIVKLHHSPDCSTSIESILCFNHSKRMSVPGCRQKKPLHFREAAVPNLTWWASKTGQSPRAVSTPSQSPLTFLSSQTFLLLAELATNLCPSLFYPHDLTCFNAGRKAGDFWGVQEIDISSDRILHPVKFSKSRPAETAGPYPSSLNSTQILWTWFSPTFNVRYSKLYYWEIKAIHKPPKCPTFIQ